MLKNSQGLETISIPQQYRRCHHNFLGAEQSHIKDRRENRALDPLDADGKQTHCRFPEYCQILYVTVRQMWGCDLNSWKAFHLSLWDATPVTVK